MDEKKPLGWSVTDPCLHGTHYQRREIERWENAGWIFLRWTESPLIVAVMEHISGDIVYIDDNGWAWKGPKLNKAHPVPLEQYPPWGFDEWIVR